jgi:hypothetical protein
LLALLEQDIPGITASLSNDSLSSQSSGIPFEFYERILHTRASLPHSLRFSSLCDAILQQALKQLDPDRLGLAIIVARCMPPSSSHRHLIRTLRESAGRGTPPWESSLEAQATFLGAESLAGHAVTVGHLVVLPNLREEYNVVPGYRDRWEESAAATPIMLAEEIAGCLLVSSTQPNYFQPAYQHLVQCYAELLALAFEAQDFYEPQRIQLGFVPPAEVQRKYLSQFRQRVAETMRQAARKQQGLSLLQAEHLVWQQIEAELLQDNLLASNTSDSTRPKGPLAHVEET